MRAMMSTPTTTDALEALRTLTRDEVDQRLAELEAERRALQTIRRSLAARDRIRGRRELAHEEGRTDG